MRRTVLFGVLAALAVILAAPRAASACGQGGYGGLFAAMAAIAATDAVVTLWDTGSLLVNHQNSGGYGVFELVVAAPQLAIGIAGLSQGNGSTNGFFAGYTIWMAALTTHAIWSIAQARRPAVSADPLDIPPQSDPAPQLQVTLGPTYVPIGLLSRPGFGLSGRF
jgi:hypothetical protein